MNKIHGLVLLIIISSLFACNNSTDTDNGDVNDPVVTTALIPFTVVNTYPHDTSFFTEGLEFYKGQLFESSGGNTDASPFPSAFGAVDLKTGRVNRKVNIDSSKFFGEGITFFKDKVYQLTWENGVGFVYDAKTFKKIKEFKILSKSKEGWGLTHDSSSLIMSDGTSDLYFLHPDSLNLVKTISVTDYNGPVGNINELEYIQGFIYANQWQTPYILKIDPATGKIIGRLDLTSIENEVKNKDVNAHELNGIAYDSGSNKILVTGKKWPVFYEIRFQ